MQPREGDGAPILSDSGVALLVAKLEQPRERRELFATATTLRDPRGAMENTLQAATLSLTMALTLAPSLTLTLVWLGATL